MKKLIYKIFLSVNLLFAFALLVSYLAVHINPESFALPAFFGLAYPYLLLVNLIMAITWAVLLRYEALISAFVIVLGFTHLTNYIQFGRYAGDKQDTFKVMSYNVRMFDNYEKDHLNSEERVFAFLKGEQADIICLQEFYLTGDPEKKDATIRTILGDEYNSHMKLVNNGKNRYYGIVTYSKYPIIRKGQIIHEKSSSLSIFSDVIINKDTFRIFNNHLQSFRLRRMESTLIEEIKATDDKETFNVMKNLSMSLREGFIRRARQANAVKTQINMSEYPVIVAGDFNDTPVSYSYRRIRKGLNDSFVNSGYGAGFTYRGNYPANRIDYILYDNTLTNLYFEIIKVRFSDHYPVTAYFRIEN